MNFKPKQMKVLLLAIVVVIFYMDCVAQQKRFYIANDDHTDYMWTANEATYDSAFVHMLDYYLHQVDSTKNNEPDYQARFNCDGNLWLKAYQNHRSPAQFNRLIAAIKSGHISAPLNMLVSCYGAQPTEAVIRGMYYAGQLERKYKLRFTLATSMENNTLPLGLASLWAGSGAKYSWKGIGGYGSQMSYDMRAKRKHQMYRYNGLDGEGVLMKWYVYNEKKWAPLGGYAECRLQIKYKDVAKDLANVVNTLDTFCNNVADGSAYPYNVAGAFGFGHDDLETYLSQPFINAARNATNQTRKVRVSNEEDFFKDFEKTYPKVPSQSVSYGNEWDLLPVSMNETTAKVRRATEKLRTAEALASIVSLKDKTFGKDLNEARNNAWESFGVYWEHNWTADGPVSRDTRAAWQIKRQKMLSDYVDTLYSRAAITLSNQISKSRSTSFYVFNPLSWSRSDVADVLFDGVYPVTVIDKSTKQEVPNQLIQKDGKQMIRIWAANLPSVGYKVFEIRKATSAKLPTAATFKNGYFSNRFYRLQVSGAGVITAIFDSIANSRQLIQQIDGRYANDLGSNENRGDLVVENAGPVSVTLKAVSIDPLLHTVRITLFATSSRIDIEDSIQENFKDVKTWAFSLNLKDPTTRHEESGAVLTAKKESAGGHYADENARYDWQTFNHFATMSEPNYGVTISNMDCSFFRLGKSTVDSLWAQSSQLNALAGGNIDKKVEDGGTLGIFNQNGQKNFLYKFALTTRQAAFNAMYAMKFSLEHQNPLATGMITGSPVANASTSFSLLSVSDPNVLLWSVKPSEEGIQNGLITRFWNMSGVAARPVLKFSRPINKAWKTSHIETNEKAMHPAQKSLQLGFKAYQINSYRTIL